MKPFLKWAGSKSKLIDKLEQFYPTELKTNKISTYIEPFLGSGSIFFDIATKYSFQKAYLFDINHKLVITFYAVKNCVNSLMNELDKLKFYYDELSFQDKEKFYYEIREKFNKDNSSPVIQASQFIFLNKTGFNGLYRENSKGHFNNSFGKYSNPKLYDKNNLLLANELLEKAELIIEDFKEVSRHVNNSTFMYLDPPYYPISKTSNFTQYTSEKFLISDQKRLKDFLDNIDCKWLLSNSDSDIQELYKKYKINKIEAKRNINCKGNKRNSILELVISNY